MPFALITGASKGIGKALAEEIARKGYDLLLVARTTSLLEALSHDIQARSGREVRFLALDLNLPGSVDTILEYIAREQIQINILINNAGY
ncbi:MAG: SDR family NAD(P)-dependent oxidoreductase, partial [Bacteroidia bacterium]|nr:SDR family NAD(P)-dependent oxidoreductase [Bacteroidia bacterium]